MGRGPLLQLLLSSASLSSPLPSSLLLFLASSSPFPPGLRGSSLVLLVHLPLSFPCPGAACPFAPRQIASFPFRALDIPFRFLLPCIACSLPAEDPHFLPLLSMESLLCLLLWTWGPPLPVPFICAQKPPLPFSLGLNTFPPVLSGVRCSPLSCPGYEMFTAYSPPGLKFSFPVACLSGNLHFCLALY